MMPLIGPSNDQVKAIWQLGATLDNDACAFRRNILDVALDCGELRADYKFTSKEDTRTWAASLFSKNGFHAGLLLFGSIKAARQ